MFISLFLKKKLIVIKLCIIGTTEANLIEHRKV